MNDEGDFLEKRELLASFEELEQMALQMQNTIAAVKEELDELVEQNAELEIENAHLRARLQELDARKKPRVDRTTKNGLSKSRQNLEQLYDEGFHVCNVDNMYGSRRINDEPCVFCQDVIYGERR